MKKIEQRPWPDLNLFEKLERVSIPVREHLLFQALLALPKRFFSELVMLVSSPSHFSLRFRQLHPRCDLIEKYGHVSDDDAVADIDPHAGILFFKSRGYKIISHPTFISRILARHEPLILCKNKS